MTYCEPIPGNYQILLVEQLWKTFKTPNALEMCSATELPFLLSNFGSRCLWFGMGYANVE